MFTYSNDTIQEDETFTDFEELGAVDISRLGGAIPFYSFMPDSGWDEFLINDSDTCGSGVSCLEYLQQYVNISFSENITDGDNSKQIFFEPRICDRNETGDYVSDTMYICPPKTGITMQYDYYSRPNKDINFEVSP